CRAPVIRSQIQGASCGSCSSEILVPGYKRGRPQGAPALSCTLIARMFCDRCLDLLLHRLQIEGGTFLHRWKVDGSLGKLAHLLLDVDEAPEFTRVEVVEVGWRTFKHVRDRQPLEGILLDVFQNWHVDRNLRPRPAFRLIDEAILELIETEAAEIGFREV